MNERVAHELLISEVTAQARRGSVMRKLEGAVRGNARARRP
jgi:FixJ family two-component response regulator